MYRVKVLTGGTYNNVQGGSRYFLTRKSTIECANNLLSSGCEIEIEKFIHLCNDAFCWADYPESTKIIFDLDNNIVRKAKRGEL